MNSTMIESVSNIGSPWGLHAPLVLSLHPRASTFERTTAMEEIWKPIKGFEGRYDVSNLGRIRSYLKRGPGKGTPRFLKGRIRSGYTRVSLIDWKNDCDVHTLVLSAFSGPRPDGYVCCHKDNNKQNNCIDNLEWGTQSHNSKDFGTQACGERQGNSKLHPLDVIVIRERRKLGLTFADISKYYNICIANTWNICMRKTWKHI
jgi:hypothetical protein